MPKVYFHLIAACPECVRTDKIMQSQKLSQVSLYKYQCEQMLRAVRPVQLCPICAAPYENFAIIPSLRETLP